MTVWQACKTVWGQRSIFWADTKEEFIDYLSEYNLDYLCQSGWLSSKRLGVWKKLDEFKIPIKNIPFYHICARPDPEDLQIADIVLRNGQIVEPMHVRLCTNSCMIALLYQYGDDKFHETVNSDYFMETCNYGWIEQINAYKEFMIMHQKIDESKSQSNPPLCGN